VLVSGGVVEVAIPSVGDPLSEPRSNARTMVSGIGVAVACDIPCIDAATLCG